MNYIYASNLDQHLGRYELIDPSKNAKKYWECLKDGDNPGKYGTRWGRIGAKNTQRARVLNADASYVADKLNEKLREGYKFAYPLNEVLQNRLADEQVARLDENTPAAPVSSASTPSKRPGRL